ECDRPERAENGIEGFDVSGYCVHTDPIGQRLPRVAKDRTFAVRVHRDGGLSRPVPSVFRPSTSGPSSQKQCGTSAAPVKRRGFWGLGGCRDTGLALVPRCSRTPPRHPCGGWAAWQEPLSRLSDLKELGPP